MNIKKSLAVFSMCPFLVFSLSDKKRKILKPYHIGYSIPESKVVKEIPQKTLDFAAAIPREDYLYDNEIDYYQGYQKAYFGVTRKRGGWDCLRHYEILANGCIPYFVDLQECDDDTLYFLPKKLIREAMNLEGVSYLKIDHAKFNKKKYHEILNQLLQHTRNYLTTRKMAAYVLETLNYSGQGKILVLSQDINPEYLRDTILIGLKEILGDRIVDVPKIKHIYDNYTEDIRNLYGRGMTYTKIIPDFPVERENIKEKIKNREFDIIIYAEIHKGKLPFHALVKRYYNEDEVAYFYCTETESEFLSKFNRFCTYRNLFLREYCFYNRAQEFNFKLM